MRVSARASRQVRLSALGVFSLGLCTSVDATVLPVARCTHDATTEVLTLGLPGVVSRLAVVRTHDAIVVAARVLPSTSTRRGETRFVVGEMNAQGVWSSPPRIVHSLPGRVDGALALAAADDDRRLVFDVGHETRVLSFHSSDPQLEHVVRFKLEPPEKGLSLSPVVASSGLGFSIVWRKQGTAWLQTLTLNDDRPTPFMSVRLPEQTLPIAVAEGPQGSTGMVIRSSAQRFFIAIVDPTGSLIWSGNAPAGCDDGRCASVQLLSSESGYLAWWWMHDTDDGLKIIAARPLGPNGRVLGPVTTFMPMSRTQVVPGPLGQPMALHLARPVLLRGGERPTVAIQSPHVEPLPNFDHPRARRLAVTTEIESFPIMASTWVRPDLGPGLEIVTSSRNGTIEHATVHCASE